MTEKPTVMIVDDSATNIQMLASCLKDSYQLKVASNGEECIGLVRAAPKPDLILLDIEMPGIDGYEVCRQLKKSESNKDIPIIFVTAKQGNDDEEKGLSLGAVDYITKPIHPSIVVARVKTHITLKLQRDKLEKLALFDQLTNLYNRHFIMEAAKEKMARAIRHNHDFSLLMIDIDNFKLINDTYGHLAGDTVLCSVAKYLNKDRRKEDVAGRFGGEEFIILLDQCDIQHALDKADLLRQTIDNLKPQGIKVTISVGVSQFKNSINESFDALVKRADDALYIAKVNGRNQVKQG